MKEKNLLRLGKDFLSKYVIIDPANTTTCRNKFSGSGASGAIYRCLGIIGTSAPDNLKSAFPTAKTIAEAAYVIHQKGHVIHTVGPQLSSESTASGREIFWKDLIKTYHSTFKA